MGETQTAARGRPYVILWRDTGCEAGVRHGETQTAARGRPYVILRERQGCEAGGETWGDTDRSQRQTVRHTAGETGV